MKSLFVKISFLLAALVALSSLVRANDSSFEGVGGSVRPTRGENKAIRMKSEVVVLTARPKDFATRAEFVFENETGRAQTVQMGFPEGNYGDVASGGPLGKTGFKRFATFVDGQRVSARRTTFKESDESGFDTYWIKTVRFAPHQTRRVRVEIVAPYGGIAQWGVTNALSYEFTGGNWRGNVGKSVLEVRQSQPGLWRAVALGKGTQILPFSLQSDGRSAVWRRVWTNWNAQQSVTFGLERAVPFWKMDLAPSGEKGLTHKMVLAAQTVRVGTKPSGFEPATGMRTPAFTQNGVVYVAAWHLEDRLRAWGDDNEPKIKIATRFDSATGRYTLGYGGHSLGFKAGEAFMFKDGERVALAAPVLSVPDGDYRSLYVPLEPVARVLNAKVSYQGERLFGLQRGNWNGK